LYEEYIVRAPNATPSEKNDWVTASYHTYISNFIIHGHLGWQKKGTREDFGPLFTQLQRCVFVLAREYQMANLPPIVSASDKGCNPRLDAILAPRALFALRGGKAPTKGDTFCLALLIANTSLCKLRLWVKFDVISFL
jgi:hypothetical protein